MSNLESDGKWDLGEEKFLAKMLKSPFFKLAVNQDRTCMQILCKATTCRVVCILKSTCKVMAQFKQFCLRLTLCCWN